MDPKSSERISRQFTGSSCDKEQEPCITCSDAAMLVRVLSVSGSDAVCEKPSGERTVVAVELVAPVGIGETILTHGGIAIGRVPSERTTG